MTHTEAVIEVARRMELLGPSLELLELDSFTIIAFVSELENLVGIAVPMENLIQQNFSTVQAVVELLEALEAQA